jgi:hypothetical protein
MHRNRAIAPLPSAVLLVALTGCASLQSHWPFAGKAVEAPQPVRELAVQVPADAAMPVVLQYWERNTLVIDLQGVTGSGSLSLAPEAGHAWPARLAFRMSPVRFQQLDVRGEQRVLLPVAAGTEATTAELPAGVYVAATARLDLRWGAAATF